VENVECLFFIPASVSVENRIENNLEEPLSGHKMSASSKERQYKVTRIETIDKDLTRLVMQ
jgi:hypothetical protein